MEKGRDGAPQYVAPRTCGLIGLGGLRKRDVVGVMRWGTDSSLIFPLSRPTDQALPRLACELSPAQPSAGVVEPQEHRRQKSWGASTPPPLLSSARPAPRPADPVPAAAPQRWRTWPVWRMEMGGTDRVIECTLCIYSICYQPSHSSLNHCVCVRIHCVIWAQKKKPAFVRSHDAVPDYALCILLRPSALPHAAPLILPFCILFPTQHQHHRPMRHRHQTGKLVALSRICAR